MKRNACAALLLLFILCTAHGQSTSLDYLNRILSGAGLQTQKSNERLSSGVQLLTDDPASYAIYQRMEAQIRGMEKSIANQGDMQAMYTAEDGALSGVVDVLQRIRELLVSKGNAMLSDDDLDIIDGEIAQNADEILRVLRGSDYNGIRYLSTFLADPVVSAQLTNPKNYTIASVDRLLAYVSTQRGVLGSQIQRLGFAVQGDSQASLNAQASQSQGDTNFATEVTKFQASQILFLSNILLLRTSSK